MAKKNSKTEKEEAERVSRKEVLMARKQREQTRQIRIVVGLVLGLLVLLFAVAIVNELVISPGRPVAEVNDSEISLADWQERVRYERAQRILLLNNQLEAFGGDVGIIQQFAGQTINELMSPDALGSAVLNQMINEVVVLDEAKARGITVSEADIDAEIGTIFNYYGGDSPTPLPLPTNTVQPTPSITPIPTQVITELLPTNTPMPTPTIGPTNTPNPTPTAVSEEAFNEEFDGLLADFRDLGIKESTYREVVRISLYREKLADALAQEREMSTTAEHASFFIVAFDNEEEANQALNRIQTEDFLTVWNEIRSKPFDPESGSTTTASEILWRTAAELEPSIGADVTNAIFALPLNQPSGVLMQEVSEGANRYYIVMVSGKEERELTEQAIDQAKQQLLASFIDEALTGNLVMTEFDAGRVPEEPRLDPLFLAQPTATPVVPGDTGTGTDTGIEIPTAP